MMMIKTWYSCGYSRQVPASFLDEGLRPLEVVTLPIIQAPAVASLTFRWNNSQAAELVSSAEVTVS